MKILSIDVGIKNLALCVIETTALGYQIKFWEVINLCEENIKICDCNTKKKKEFIKCTQEAKFTKNNHYYCKSHAKKSEFKIPTSDLNKYKRLKIDELQKLIINYDITLVGPNTKINLIKHIETYINTHVLQPINNIECNKFSLIDIGTSIKNNLDNLFIFILQDIDVVLIENQISPLANRMNCIQGMLCQYFIMKDLKNILFVSATNKLKFFIGKNKTTYSERKKKSIDITKKLLIENNHENDKILEMFNKHKKKDDLADCFLQGIWYLIEKIPNKSITTIIQNITNI